MINVESSRQRTVECSGSFKLAPPLAATLQQVYTVDVSEAYAGFAVAGA